MVRVMPLIVFLSTASLSQRTEMERLKEDEPNISHQERCVPIFVVRHTCVSTPCLDLKWLPQTGKLQRRTPRRRNLSSPICLCFTLSIWTRRYLCIVFVSGLYTVCCRFTLLPYCYLIYMLLLYDTSTLTSVNNSTVFLTCFILT